MEKTMNIPGISVGTALEEMEKMYLSALGKGISLSAVPSVFLWGPPGVGKSESVKEMGVHIGNETGKKIRITEIRLLLFSPVDLRGVPFASADRQFTDWLRPRIFDLDVGEDTVNILFLDELSACTSAIQSAAYQIVLDRAVGEHRLPDNTIIICAGNRVTDRSVAYQMPSALANRLIHFDIRPDFDSWADWAAIHDIHPMVMGYLSFDRSKLYVDCDGDRDVAYATPRSWTFVSDMLKLMDVTETVDIHYLIAGAIGEGTAVEFESYVRVFRELPKTEDIFQGKPGTILPKKRDALYAVISSLGAAALEKSRNQVLSQAELVNAVKYAVQFPMDYAAAFFRHLHSEQSVRLQLMKIPVYQNWVKKNGKYL